MVGKTRFSTNVRAPSGPNGQWGPAACLQPPPQADTDASGFEHRARNVNLHVRVVVVDTRLSLPSLDSCSAECQVRPVVLLLDASSSSRDSTAMRCAATRVLPSFRLCVRSVGAAWSRLKVRWRYPVVVVRLAGGESGLVGRGLSASKMQASSIWRGQTNPCARESRVLDIINSGKEGGRLLMVACIGGC